MTSIQGSFASGTTRSGKRFHSEDDLNDESLRLNPKIEVALPMIAQNQERPHADALNSLIDRVQPINQTRGQSLEEILDHWVQEGDSPDKINDRNYARCVIMDFVQNERILRIEWINNTRLGLKGDLGELADIFHFPVFQRLNNLELFHCHLTKLPNSISKLIQLNRLSLGGNLFIRFPECITELKELNILWMMCCKLTNISDSIGNLQKLTQLNLNHNDLINLSESIFELKELKELGLEENKLTSISAKISNLTKLHTLRLKGNHLTALPNEIGVLTQLRDINIERNSQLTSLPNSIMDLDRECVVNAEHTGLSQNNIHRLIEASQNNTRGPTFYFPTQENRYFPEDEPLENILS